jgi:hypothetical protein
MCKKILIITIVVVNTFIACSNKVRTDKMDKMYSNTKSSEIILEGKQPLSLNWVTFVEAKKDSIVIETYNFDKPPDIDLIGERIVLSRRVDPLLDKENNEIIAHNDNLSFLYNNKEGYEIKKSNGITIKLEQSNDLGLKLNSARNLAFLSSERTRIRIEYGSKTVRAVDSLYRTKQLFDLAKKNAHENFMEFYKLNVSPNITKIIGGD